MYTYSKTETKDEENIVMSMNASWAYNYRDVEEMAQNSDRIALVTVQGVENTVVEIDDDPLLQTGDKILVFCKENTDGTYRTLSGSQGRLIYSDGKLNSLNAVSAKVREANSYSNILVQNADAEALIQEIKEYVNEK